MTDGLEKGMVDHEENAIRVDPGIPGTIDMSVVEGGTTAYGLALYPVPSNDPNDPLQWPRWKKNTLLFIVSIFSFLANGALFGPSVYTNYLAEQFQKTANEISHLVTYPNLLFGFGSLVAVPLYYKIGRRPVMLVAVLLYCVGLLGCALSNTYDVLLGFRMLHAFASSVCEALPVQVVADVFFIHERGKALGWYTFALVTGTLSAVAASYMLSGGLSYNLFFWVEFGLGCLLFLGTFFFFEETMFFRNPEGSERGSSTETDVRGTEEKSQEEGVAQPMPPRKSYRQQLKFIDTIDPKSPIFMMMARSFTYFLVPPVVWVCATYGMVIGLSGLAFTSTFPVIVAAPPYSWATVSDPATSYIMARENTGLVAISSLIGYLAAAGPFATVPDRFAAKLTRQNNNIRESEYRLWCLVIVLFVSPASLILYGYAAERQLHWIGLVFAVGIFQFGAFFYLTYTLAYAIDSYNANIPEMLIAMNIGKQAISFGFGFAVIDWISENGYIRIFAGIFCGVLAANNCVVFVFLAFGKPMRRWFGQTWLAKMHRESIG